ncbi:MAG: DegT/DnrJ/EryC1/StrS family aminotransferase [Euryarchaeota archaeon]|nr:DegT/DnrJ/EryC1/StrS family aminotransferase [Euryarchaeota archaeon]
MKYNLVEMYVGEDVINAAVEVIKSKRYIKGPQSKAFEEEFANYIGAKHGVTTSSGTTALWLIYDALGIKNGAEFIAPSHTFIATVTPAMHMGAKPIFAEIDEKTYTLDPEDVRKKITDKTKAIVAVHLYGHPADVSPLKELAEEHDLYFIEDCAQAHGAMYHGEKIGKFGDAAAFSFFPSKVMTVAGDGGMVLTSNDEIGEMVRVLHDQGRREKYEHEYLGYNFRMSEILAAIGRAQLRHLDDWLNRRNEIAKIYSELLNDVVITPAVQDWARHAYYVYTIRAKNRDALREHLKKHEIATGLYYPIPVHLQPAVKNVVPPVKLPITEQIVSEILSLPMHPFMSDEDAEFIAKKVIEFYR